MGHPVHMYYFVKTVMGNLRIKESRGKSGTCKLQHTHVCDVVLPQGREVGDPQETLDDLLLGGHLLREFLGDDVLVHVGLLLHLLQQALRRCSSALSHYDS